MGKLFSKAKNDPKVGSIQIERYFLAMKGETSITISHEDLNFRTEAVRDMQYNWSLLHLAVWFMNKEMVKELLSHGFDKDLADIVQDKQHNDTPLHIAAYQGDKAIYEMLVAAGANSSAKNKVRTIQEGKVPGDLFNSSQYNYLDMSEGTKEVICAFGCSILFCIFSGKSLQPPIFFLVFSIVSLHKKLLSSHTTLYLLHVLSSCQIGRAHV